MTLLLHDVLPLHLCFYNLLSCALRISTHMMPCLGHTISTAEKKNSEEIQLLTTGFYQLEEQFQTMHLALTCP